MLRDLHDGTQNKREHAGAGEGPKHARKEGGHTSQNDEPDDKQCGGAEQRQHGEREADYPPLATRQKAALRGIRHSRQRLTVREL